MSKNRAISFGADGVAFLAGFAGLGSIHDGRGRFHEARDWVWSHHRFAARSRRADPAWYATIAQPPASSVEWQTLDRRRSHKPIMQRSCILLLVWLIGLGLLRAATAIDEESPWPRTRSANGNTITLHMPEIGRAHV